MAIRGVYTEAEQEMIAAFNKDADMLVGWAKPLSKQVASEDSIKNMAVSVDCWNPLWTNENYAMNTRWGGIIAPPMYQERFGFLHLHLQATTACGFPDYMYIGEDWDFFKPVRINDSFKLWRRRPQLEDVTSLDGKGPRKFKLLAYDVDHINQRDELVSTLKIYAQAIFLPGPPETPISVPEYVYTSEELEAIDRVAGEEEIRGANIRWWEDVNIDDKIRMVVLGPTTIADMANFSAGMMGIFPSLRGAHKKAAQGLILDPVTGVYHSGLEVHMSERIAQLTGQPRAFHLGSVARQLIARLVTNWMGDDGFIRKCNWRHMSRTFVGDTVIGRGKITNKHVENGEHLVDLAVWLENMRGNVTEAAVATVSLCSKKASYKWK
jgi:acyl dehydratase